MKFIRVAGLVFFLAMLCPHLSYSQEVDSPSASSDETLTGFPKYFQQFSDKFDFGAINLLTGWTEAVSEPIERTEKAKGFWKKTGHAFGGFGLGLGYGLLDTLGGAGNLITSPIPQFRIPLPQGGINLEKLTG